MKLEQGIKMEQAAKKENGKDFYEAVADSYRQSSKTMGNEYFVLDGDRHLIERAGTHAHRIDIDAFAVKPRYDSLGHGRA